MSRYTFHEVCGQNVEISAVGTEARQTSARLDNEVGLVFTAAPLTCGEQLCLQVVKSGGASDLILGLTSNDPQTLVDVVHTNAWKPYLMELYRKEGKNVNVHLKEGGDVFFWRDDWSHTYSFSGVDVSRLWLVAHVPGGGSVRLVGPSARRKPPLTLQHSFVQNLRPLSFHRVRGECISTDDVGWIKLTTSSSNSHDGLVFSARPVRVNEKVCLQILCGEVHVGFTSCDPATAARPGTDTVAEELYDASRYWLGSVGSISWETIYLYVNSAGEVHVGVRGTPERRLCSGVSTGAPLWAVVRVTSGEVGRNNAVAVGATWRYSPLRGGAALSAAPSAPQQPPLEGVLHPGSLRPLSFHPVRGKSVAVTDHVSAECTEPLEKPRDGLVFSARPIELNEKVFIRTVVAPGLRGKVEIGFTTYDPATLTSHGTNVVSVNLTDKSKYWLEAFEENINLRFMYFYVNASGEVYIGAECINEYLLFSGVNTSAPLWAVIKIMQHNTTVSCSKAPEVRPERAHGTNGGTTNTQTNIRDPQSRPTSSRDLQDPLACTVCSDNVKDTALVSCGHMCMCYTCALQLWQGHERGVCPVCRAQIEGILRVYS